MTRNRKAKYQLLGPLRADEYSGLRADIEKRGVMVPVEVDEDGEILDGHHRAEIADSLGLKYKTIVRRFGDELEKQLHVYELNLSRRHLNATQRAAVGVGYESIIAAITKRGRPKKGTTNGTVSGKASDLAAEKVGVSRGYISDAKRIKRTDPRTFGEMLAGNVEIKEVLREERKQTKDADRKKRAKAAAKAVVGKDYGVHCERFQDGMAKLADDSVDLIFTDPPYDRKSLPMYGDMAEIAARVLKPGGSLLCYAGNYILPETLDLVTPHLRFWWVCGCLHTGKLARMTEYGVVVKWKPILWFVKKTRGDKHTFVDDMIESKPEKDAHDWQQGTIEAEYYIEKLTEPGDLVVDPFCGGGTTAVAAARLKRRWKMYEIDKDSAAIARKRIRDDAKRR